MNTSIIYKQFTEIYEAESDGIFRFCLVRVSDREQALDLTQETFAKTWQFLSDGKTLTHARTFLYTVARNLIIDWYRKKKSISLETLMEENNELYDAADGGIHANVAFGSEGRLLLECISKLNPTYQEVVRMRFVEDLPPSEIAEILKLSANVVSVRINRGIEELKRITGYEITDLA